MTASAKGPLSSVVDCLEPTLVDEEPDQLVDEQGISATCTMDDLGHPLRPPPRRELEVHVHLRDVETPGHDPNCPRRSSEVREKALAHDRIRELLQGKEIRKVIVVPNKLVNIVAAL